MCFVANSSIRCGLVESVKQSYGIKREMLTVYVTVFFFQSGRLRFKLNRVEIRRSFRAVYAVSHVFLLSSRVFVRVRGTKTERTSRNSGAGRRARVPTCQQFGMRTKCVTRLGLRAWARKVNRRN